VSSSPGTQPVFMSRHAVCPGFAGFPCGHIGNIVALREPSLATKRRYGPSEVATAQTREKTLEGQQAAAARGNHGGRSKVLDEDDVLFARALRDKGTPMPGTAKTRGNGSKDVARLVARHPRKRPGRFRRPARFVRRGSMAACCFGTPWELAFAAPVLVKDCP